MLHLHLNMVNTLRHYLCLLLDSQISSSSRGNDSPVLFNCKLHRLCNSIRGSRAHNLSLLSSWDANYNTRAEQSPFDPETSITTNVPHPLGQASDSLLLTHPRGYLYRDAPNAMELDHFRQCSRTRNHALGYVLYEKLCTPIAPTLDIQYHSNLQKSIRQYSNFDDTHGGCASSVCFAQSDEWQWQTLR